MFQTVPFQRITPGKSFELMFMNVWEPCFQDKAILLFIIIIDPKGLQFVCVCVCFLQYHSPPEHEAGNRCEPPQGNHRQGHLCSAPAAPQALQTQPCLSG